jgi:hypothetical protein
VVTSGHICQKTWSQLSKINDFFDIISSRYAHPRTVLDYDHATLMAVDGNMAVFAVCEEHDVYDPRTHPFVFIMQFLQSTRLIIMPISSFHR